MRRRLLVPCLLVALGCGSGTEPRASGQIAYERLGGDGSFEIAVMNVDGSGARTLIAEPTPVFQPAWSPDGRRIAFTCERGGHREVCVADADGSGIRRVTTGLGNQAPAWFPDGSMLAFESRGTVAPGIHAIGLDGSGERALVGGAFAPSGPTVSADGRSLAYHQFDGPDGTPTVYRLDIASGASTRLADSSLRAAYSPDGRRIAVSRIVPEGSSYELGIATVGADGSGARVLTHPQRDQPCDSATPFACGSFGDQTPRWSPDGGFVTFARTRTDASPSAFAQAVLVVRADGSAPRQLTPFGRNAAPSWRP